MQEMKRCTKCKEVLPATTEYFYRAKSCKYGLHSHCKKCRREIDRKWRENNPEKHKENAMGWVRENRDRYKERVRIWRENNPDKCKSYSRRWYENNKDKNNIRGRRYKAKLNCLPKDLTPEQWEVVKQEFDNKCLLRKGTATAKRSFYSRKQRW